jgi:serine/threonine protein kinase
MGARHAREVGDGATQLPEEAWTEVGLINLLNERCLPFATRLLGVFYDEDYAYAVTPWAADGDLFSWCQRLPAPGMQREKLVLPVAVQIFSGVAYLHEVRITHGDLSLENVIVAKDADGETRIQLIDFGLATLSRTCMRSAGGKPSYQAPEIHQGKPYDGFSADVFASGVLLFAMSAQDYPWMSTRPGKCPMFGYAAKFGFRKLLEKRRLPKFGSLRLSEAFSAELTHLLENLLLQDPALRPCLGGRECAAAGQERLETTRQCHSVLDMPWWRC